MGNNFQNETQKEIIEVLEESLRRTNAEIDYIVSKCGPDISNYSTRQNEKDEIQYLLSFFE